MRFAILISTALFAHFTFADLTIFDVQRNLPLASGEKVYHDYYVDGGREAGLRTGMVLTVQRRVPLYDYYRARPVGDLQSKVAKVKVIDVQDGLAVVRLREEISREDQPLADDNFIMIGDHLDLQNDVADVEVPAPTLAVAPPPPPAPVAKPAPAAAAAPAPKADAAPAGQIVINSVTISADDAKIAEPVPTPAPAPAAPATTAKPASK